MRLARPGRIEARHHHHRPGLFAATYAQLALGSLPGVLCAHRVLRVPVGAFLGWRASNTQKQVQGDNSHEAPCRTAW